MTDSKQVESLPFLGRSWYRRGPGYWARRALYSVVCLLVLGLFTFISWSLVQAIATDNEIPWWVKVLVLAVIAAAIAYSVIRAWRALNVMNRVRRGGRAMSLAEAAGARRAGRATTASGTAVGALARAGSVVGGALLVVSVVFNFGWGVVLLVMSFQRYFSPEEFAAWQKLNRTR